MIQEQQKQKDPNGLSAHQPGAKLDNGKPDASLLLMFGRALAEVARVGTYGSNKYTRGGWQSVSDGVNRYTAAMLRHLLSENQGIFDGESGLRHASQVAWNALARLELILRKEEMIYVEEAHGPVGKQLGAVVKCNDVARDFCVPTDYGVQQTPGNFGQLAGSYATDSSWNHFSGNQQ